MWNCLKNDLPSSFFEQDNFEVWLLHNLKAKSGGIAGKWDLGFAVTLDRLWLTCNELVFKQIPPSTAGTVARIKNLVDDIAGSVVGMKAMGKRTCGQQGVSDIRCESPNPGMIKLNCDGAVKSYPETAACGGVLRNHNGSFLCGFAVKLGNCTVPQAELWAIIHGLRLAKEKGFSNIQIEFDSLTAINFINGGCLACHLCRPLVNEINKLLHDVDRAQVSHVIREANQVADRLANHGLSLEMTCKVFDVISDFLIPSLMGNVCNTWYPRGF